jgi:hypothetical protein
MLEARVQIDAGPLARVEAVVAGERAAVRAVTAGHGVRPAVAAHAALAAIGQRGFEIDAAGAALAERPFASGALAG